jgi:phenylacetate-CoA ligase
VVGYTAADLDVWREVMARVMVAAGARAGDLLHVAFGYGLFTGGLGFHQGAERIGLTVVPASSGNTARQCLLLRDLRPSGIAATPSFALHIAETLAEQGSKPGESGLRYGMFGAEPWSEGLRHAIEAGLGCRACDIYGLSEIIGPGVSGECEAREGLHICDDHFLPEVVDPASGAPLPPGRQGELVLTTLTKRAMPLIRYRTGDITALTLEPCRCGRTSARMARLIGRADDMLIIKGVNVYPSEVEQALLDLEDLVPQYRLVVDRTGTLARVEVQVEPAPAFLERCGNLESGGPAVAALRERVAGRLRAALGLSVDVTLLPARTLPRSEGKAVRVVERTEGKR